jgi:hypothetical protein
MQLKTSLVALFLSFSVAAGAQQTQSTVSPNVPAVGAIVEQSGPAFRANFQATINDLNVLFGRINGGTSPLIVATSPVTGGVPNCVLTTFANNTLNCTSLLTAFPGAGFVGISGSLNIAPAANSLGTGLVMSMTPAGSSAPSGDALNLLFIPSDNAVMTGAGRFLNLYEISYVCCSSLAQGGRSGFS